MINYRDHALAGWSLLVNILFVQLPKLPNKRTSPERKKIVLSSAKQPQRIANVVMGKLFFDCENTTKNREIKHREEKQ